MSRRLDELSAGQRACPAIPSGGRTMTDRESERRENADRLVTLMADNGIEYIRFELPDMHGTSRSKTIPAAKAGDYALHGLNFYGGVLGLDTSSNVVPASGLHGDRVYAD